MNLLQITTLLILSVKSQDIPTNGVNGEPCYVYSQCVTNAKANWQDGYCKTFQEKGENATVIAECNCYFYSEWAKCFVQCPLNTTVQIGLQTVITSAESTCKSVGWDYKAPPMASWYVDPKPAGSSPYSKPTGAISPVKSVSKGKSVSFLFVVLNGVLVYLFLN